mgnify:FL=1|jgi:pseudouridine-5'-phosphate glycosidase
MAQPITHTHLDILPEVADALSQGRPVVALESTIISHGMPWPQNAEMANTVEEAVRATGAIPATIAVIAGRLKVGLTTDEIQLLARQGDAVMKCSRRDLPYVVSQGKHGATTVSATMIIAHMAGIRVFATGGIGGVHRGASESMDISADLTELGRTPVAVVCAGVKSILDIGLTLEYLETQGVPVLGFQTAALPAFYSRDSGFGVDFAIDSPADVARFLKAQWSMGMTGGAVIANPVPEADSLPREMIDAHISQALTEADAQGIKGKNITPFLLKRVTELTDGVSLVTNIALVLNNAKVAGEIAVAYSAQG